MNKRKKGAGKITQSGNLPRPGQKGPATIILTQPRRFGIDIADYMLAVRAFENVDYSRRFRLYDLFSDILMDTHLTSVIEKRKNAALASSIEFRRNGKPDEKVNKQIRSPWFRKFIGDILDAKFWGFSLVQFYRKGEWVNYDLIPRKHVDPVRRLILRHQTDTTGTSWDEYPDLLFIGSPDDPGLLVKAAIWVIYKRNDVADWAQFAEVFGAPIREYTYPTDDDEARQRALDDADSTGSLSVFVHAEDTVLKLVEVIRGQLTADSVFDSVSGIAKNIGKVPVTVNEAPGFLVNRLLRPMINEGIGALAEGVASKEEIDEAMKLGAGHPIGPLALADLIGLDVCLAILEVLHHEFGDDKYRPHPLLRKMVRANLLGRKTGTGFYDYQK